MSQTNFHTAYISFGSNKGDRLNHIIKSLKEMEIQIGRIEGVSRLYKTKSWGFDSWDFYNGCVVLKTKYLSDIVLKKLLFIENSLGRAKDESEKYSAREIDLDLLFFNELIISTKELIIPHPQIHKRNFVLFPMCDISPDFIHPKINVSIKKLLAKCEDNSEVKIIKNNKYYTPFWERYSFISIEGNIGVGKTTLSKIFNSHFDIELLNENYSKNPFLKEFYCNPKNLALKVENFLFWSLKKSGNKYTGNFIRYSFPESGELKKNKVKSVRMNLKTVDVDEMILSMRMHTWKALEVKPPKGKFESIASNQPLQSNRLRTLLVILGLIIAYGIIDGDASSGSEPFDNPPEWPSV